MRAALYAVASALVLLTAPALARLPAPAAEVNSPPMPWDGGSPFYFDATIGSDSLCPALDASNICGDGTAAKPWRTILKGYGYIQALYDLEGKWANLHLNSACATATKTYGDNLSLTKLLGTNGLDFQMIGCPRQITGTVFADKVVLKPPAGGYALAVAGGAKGIVWGVKGDHSNQRDLAPDLRADMFMAGDGGSVLAIESDVTAGYQLNIGNAFAAVAGGDLRFNKLPRIRPLSTIQPSYFNAGGQIAADDATDLRIGMGCAGTHMNFQCRITGIAGNLISVWPLPNGTVPSTAKVPLTFTTGGQNAVLVGDGARVYCNTNTTPNLIEPGVIEGAPFFYAGFWRAQGLSVSNCGGVEWHGWHNGPSLHVSGNSIHHSGGLGAPNAPGSDAVRVSANAVSANCVVASDASKIQVGNLANGYAIPRATWTTGGLVNLDSTSFIAEGARTMGAPLYGSQMGGSGDTYGLGTGNVVDVLDIGNSRAQMHWGPSTNSPSGGVLVEFHGYGVVNGSVVTSVDPATSVVCYSKMLAPASFSGLPVVHAGFAVNGGSVD